MNLFSCHLAIAAIYQLLLHNCWIRIAAPPLLSPNHHQLPTTYQMTALPILFLVPPTLPLWLIVVCFIIISACWLERAHVCVFMFTPAHSSSSHPNNLFFFLSLSRPLTLTLYHLLILPLTLFLPLSFWISFFFFYSSICSQSLSHTFTVLVSRPYSCMGCGHLFIPSIFSVTSTLPPSLPLTW